MFFRIYKRGSLKVVCIFMRYIVVYIYSVVVGLFVFFYFLFLYSLEGFWWFGYFEDSNRYIIVEFISFII